VRSVLKNAALGRLDLVDPFLDGADVADYARLFRSANNDAMAA
jgi:hypothetical protein